jgi:hypothetical protein
MATQFLKPHDRYSRLGTVNTEGVPEVVDRDVGTWNTRRIPTTVVELAGQCRGLEEPATAPVVIEGGQEFWDRNVAIARHVLEAAHAGQ